MTGRHSAVRADTDPVSAEAALRALARKLLGPRFVPGAWALAGVLAGAALTSIVFLALWPDDPAIAERGAPATTENAAATTAKSATASPPAATAKSATASPPTATAKAATASPPTATAKSATASPPTATAKAATAKAATAKAATAPRARPPSAKAATANTATRARSAPAPSPASAVFSPAAGGDAALVAVRACVAADRKVQFGASLYYDAASGLSRRVFFGAIEQLDPSERACLDDKLLGLPAGAAPARAAVVTYSFHLAPAGDHVKARLNASP